MLDDRARAAQAWCAWEDTVLSQEDYGPSNPYSDRPDDELLAFVRICTHYFAHRVWLEDNQLIRDVDRLAGIPAVLLHGRLDLSGPAVNAWELSKAWPQSRLTIFNGSGHKGNEAMGDAIVSATDEFALR